MGAVSSLEKSRQIRNLIKHIELSDNKSPDIDNWLAWPERVADDYDPMHNLGRLLKEHDEIAETPRYIL